MPIDIFLVGSGGGYYSEYDAPKKSARKFEGTCYIGNPLLTNKLMYCYNCAPLESKSTKAISTTNVSSSGISNYEKSGDGYARITLIKIK